MAPTPTSSSPSCSANTPSHAMASTATATQNDAVPFMVGNWGSDGEDRWGCDWGVHQERGEEIGGEAAEEEVAEEEEEEEEEEGEGEGEVEAEVEDLAAVGWTRLDGARFEAWLDSLPEAPERDRPYLDDDDCDEEEEEEGDEEMPSPDDLGFGRFAIIQVVHTGRFIDGRELVEYWGRPPRGPIDLGGVAPAPGPAMVEDLIDCEAGVGPGARSDDCPVCHEDIGTEERVVTHERCGNTFCESCLFEWANESRGNGRHTTCPMCQGLIVQGPGGLVELERELQENVRRWFVSEGDEHEIEGMWESEREAETALENPGGPAHHIDYEPNTYIPPPRTLRPDDLDTLPASLRPPPPDLHLDMPTSYHVSPARLPQPLHPDVRDIVQVRLRPTPPPPETDNDSSCTPDFGPAPSPGANTADDTTANAAGEAATEADPEGATDQETDPCPICLHSIPPSTPSLTHNLCHTTFCASCLLAWAASCRKGGEAVTCPWDRTALRLPSPTGSGSDDDLWDYASDGVMMGFYVLGTLTWVVFSLWVYGLLVFGCRVVGWNWGWLWERVAMVLGWSWRVGFSAVVSLLGWVLWGLDWGMTIVEVFWFAALLGLIWWLGRGGAGEVFWWELRRNLELIEGGLVVRDGDEEGGE